MFDHFFSKGGLSLERLHTLIKLSEAGSLIRAAANDAGQQSRMSHHIRELSSFFGVDLTCRVGRSVKLTQDGEALVRLLREQFAALDSFRESAVGAIPTYNIATQDSIAQWLVVPAIGLWGKERVKVRFNVLNVRTREIVARLNDLRAEFGVLRADAVVKPLCSVPVCDQRYALFIPRRLVPKPIVPSIRDGLLEFPHAAIAGDGQLMERLQEICHGHAKRRFIPGLSCESIGQCAVAVETGNYAAVLPVQAWKPRNPQDYWVIEDKSLAQLTRRLVVAWHPRMMDVRGSIARKCQVELLAVLKQIGKTSEAA